MDEVSETFHDDSLIGHAINPPPGYELADRIALTTPAQVRAVSDQLRTAILGPLDEREATVTGWRAPRREDASE